jgi:hypothetical protein
MAKMKSIKEYEKNGKKVEEFDLEINLYDTSAVAVKNTTTEIATPEKMEEISNRVLTGKTISKVIVRDDKGSKEIDNKKTSNVEKTAEVKVEPPKPVKATTVKSNNNNTVIRR